MHGAHDQGFGNALAAPGTAYTDAFGPTTLTVVFLIFLSVDEILY